MYIRNKMTVKISSAIQAKLARLNLQITKEVPDAIKLSNDTLKQCLSLFSF